MIALGYKPKHAAIYRKQNNLFTSQAVSNKLK